MSAPKGSNFLASLYRMCNQDNAQHRECIHWDDSGSSFWVSSIEKFARDLLPIYYKHNNYASFVRQLNMYGFHRSTDTKGRIEPGVEMVEHFTHPYFQRGREDLLTHIHRKSSSKVMKKSRSVKGEDGASDTRLQQELTSLRESQLQLAETMRQMQEAFMAVQIQHNQEIEQLKAKIVELSPRQPIVKSEVVLIEDYNRRREDFIDSPPPNQPEQQQVIQQQNNGFGNLLDLVDDEHMDWNDNKSNSSDEFSFRNTWQQPQVAGV